MWLATEAAYMELIDIKLCYLCFSYYVKTSSVRHNKGSAHPRFLRLKLGGAILGVY